MLGLYASQIINVTKDKDWRSGSAAGIDSECNAWSGIFLFTIDIIGMMGKIWKICSL